MRATTMNTAHAPLQLSAAIHLWLESSGQVLRTVGRVVWNALYAITKARILSELGERRPARRRL